MVFTDLLWSLFLTYFYEKNVINYLDEEIHGKEPTWEEQEIERLKKKIEKLENKLEDKECCIEMAVEYINKHPVNACHNLLNILEEKNESN